MKKAKLRYLKIAVVLTAAICFLGCSLISNNKKDKAAIKWQKIRLIYYSDSVFPKINALVRNGDMITRLGTDITSEMLRQMNQVDKSFSHCGIASIENDTIFVYHAIGGEFNPDQKLKREPLFNFCHPSENKAVGVFNMALDSITIRKLISIVQTTYRNGIPFDLKFDYKTDDRLYCAEFVSKSYGKAIRDNNWFHFSVRNTFKYVAVDNLFLNKNMVEKAHLTY